MTAEAAFERIGDLIAKARDLAQEYKQLTGKPLGITGEVAEYEAARLLGLSLADARMPGYDALQGERRLQIKGRVIGKGAKPGQRLSSIRLDHEWDAVLLVTLDDDLQVTEIWEAERPAVEGELAKPDSKARDRGALGVSAFKRIAERRWPEGAPIPQSVTRRPLPQTDQTARYSSTRLTFKKAIIDQLGMDDEFEIETSEGLYRFTKREFFEVFGSVVSSVVYSRDGFYNYKTTPEKTGRFLVEPCDA